MDNSIVKYDERTKKIENYTDLSKSLGDITCILPFSDGTIWLGSTRGLLLVDAKKEPKLIIDQVSVTTVYQDKNGNIWVGTLHDGVFVIGVNGSIESYKSQKDSHSLSNNQIRCFVEDDLGDMWIATFYGLNRFNTKTKEWNHYINDDALSHSLSHSSVFSLYKDKQGTIWVGSYFGGVNYFNPTADIFRFYESNSSMSNSLSFPYVSEMAEDKHGNLWVCTEGGFLNCLNLKTQEFSRYVLDGSKPIAGYNQKTIWYCAEKDLLYIGLHNRGLVVFDIKARTARMFTKSEGPNSLPSNTINKIQYHKVHIYMLTQGGLVKMDPQHEVFFNMKNDSVVEHSFNSGISVNTFYIDSKDRLWIIRGDALVSASMKTGVVKMYKYDGLNPRSIGNLSISDIFENSKGDIFFATFGSGLYKYAPSTDDFDNFTVENNELSSNYCYNITESPSGKLILLHNKGFSFFDPDRPKENLFRSSSNFPIVGFNVGNSCYVTRDNDIFIGGINGLISFKENNLNKISKGYSLFFDRLFVNNLRVYPGDHSGVLKETLPLSSGIDLKYDQNNITIEFATSNYLQSMIHKYEYRLEGFDEDWTPLINELITYTNLNVGHYNLQVRLISEEGVEESVHSLAINIKPPFYATTFAFIVFFIIISSCICYTVLYLERKITEYASF